MNLFDVAYRALMLQDPDAKCAAATGLLDAWHHGTLQLDEAVPVIPVEIPGRPDRPLLVSPHQVEHRGLGSPEGRAALIHALAHIEFNAIKIAP
jgi:uncharacterized ferritin-like protein (DUF455 family)